MAINQIKAGAVFNYVIIGLNTLVGLLYTPYMLRCLGQNDYGLYSLVASVIAYLTILDFGFGNAIIRYTAKFRAEGKLQEQWEMFGMFLIVYSVIGLIAFSGGLALYFNVDSLFDRTMDASDLATAQTMMLLLTVNLAFTFPLSIFGSIISAYENFVFQKVLQIIRILLSTVTIIVLLYVGYKAIALVVVQTAFNIMTLLLNFFYCIYRLKIKIWFRKFNWSFLKEISIYSFWIFLNAIMDKIYWSTGQFVLGAVSGTIAVAIFSVAITLEQMFMTFSVAISSVLLPKITKMVVFHESDKAISGIFISTGRLQAFILFLVTCGFIVFGEGFIHFWAGEGYSQSYWVTLIFFVTLFTPLIQNVGINILQARNQMKFRSLSYVVIAAVSLVMQIWLSKVYGPVGCALAIGIALLFGQGIIMNIYYQKVQRLNIKRFWKEIVRLAIIPTVLTLAGLISKFWVDYNHTYTLVIGIAAFSILYIVGMYKFSMNENERFLFLQPIRKLIRRA